MIESEKKLFTEFLSKTLNLTTEEMASLYNEAGELTDTQVLLTKDAERVAKFKKEKDDQFKAGQKKAAEKIERELKEQYNVDSDLQGIELVNFVLESQTAAIKEKSKLKDDDFEKHPKYASLKLEHEKQLKEKEKEWQGKFDAREQEINRTNTVAKVKELVLQQFDELNPILPEDTTKAGNLKRLFLKEFDGLNYQVDGKEVILLDDEGKPKADDHGNLIKLKDIVKTNTEMYFSLRKGTERSSSGNQNNNTQSTVTVPKNKEEFYQKLSDPNLKPEERVQLLNSFEGKTV